MGSESTTGDTEVDTGPGLEAHTSWDYSHLSSPPPIKRAPVGPLEAGNALGQSLLPLCMVSLRY